jgi:ATP-binding cassette subfamily B (MDR/TAP) protein 1
MTPLIVVGQWIGMEFQKGLTNETKELNNQADLLCGDCIMNYKTVQSMGNEDKFCKKYYEYLHPITQASRIKHIKAGFAFGLSQCLLYAVFAGLFYFGGLLIENSYDEKTNTYEISPEDIFIAMFAIFFGASQAGTAMSLGPDIGKAQIAAKNVFRIIEAPSKINALEQNNNK